MMPPHAEKSAVYLFDGHRVDVAKRLVYGPDSKPIPLKAKAFDTLVYLVENPGRIVERDELLAAVWPDTVVEENNLTQHISSLRRLFGETKDEHRFIVTVPGRGYKFAADVTRYDRDPISPDPNRFDLRSRKWLIGLAGAVVVSLL